VCGANIPLCVADEKRASIKSCKEKGVTLSLEVPNINDAWRDADKAGLIQQQSKSILGMLLRSIFLIQKDTVWKYGKPLKKRNLE